MPRVLHVLHVDDDEEIRQIVALSLGLSPTLSPVGAGDAREALALAGNGTGPRPDAVLLDYSIGADDGVNLLGELRRLPGLATIPAVFLTGRLRTYEQDRMMAAGAAGVLRKPFNPLTLAHDLRGLLTG